MGTMKWIAAALLGGLLAFGIVGCGSGSNDTTTMSLALTDAPLDDIENVKEVNVTITNIEYHVNGEWKTFDGFVGPQMFNLLDLREGNVTDLGSIELEGGHYTQIRFELDGDGTADSNCFITYENNDTLPLFVPSGTYKAIGEYNVPINGDIALTVDFDVRKSVVKRGNSGHYNLKPTMRLIANQEAGGIRGYIDYSGDYNLTVYAYEDGNYTDSESNETTEGIRFPNAVTSVDVHTDGNFYLAFLAGSMNYDLVVVETNTSGYVDILGYINDIPVDYDVISNIGTATVEATY